MTVFGREKGRARRAQRPFDIYTIPLAACQSGLTEIIDGDAREVFRNALEFKCAVAEFHGDGHESAQSCRT